MENKTVAPEGGWGYLVAVGVGICLVIITGQTLCFGIMYGDFYEMLGGKTSNITFSISMFYLCSSIAGLFANSLQKRFSCRQIGLAAAIMYVSGSFLTTFVNSLPQMLITYSFLQGVAFGTMVPAIYSAFNAYFIKKRLMVHYISKPFTAAGRLCSPFLIYSLREKYGFRGMLAVLAAITSHMILAMTVMQPVEWHMTTKREINDEAKKQTELNGKDGVTLEVIEPLLNEENSEAKQINNLDVSNESLHKNINQDKKECDNEALDKDIETEDGDRRASKWLAIKNFFDLTLFKDLVYVNILIGMCACEFSSNTFVALIPIHLEKLGWSKADVSICISGAGFADFVATIVLALISIFCKPKSRNVYLIAVLLSIPARIAVTFVTGFSAMLSTLSVIWFLRTFLVVNNFMVIAEHCEAKRFAAGFGLYLFCQGISTVAMGSIAGLIRDLSGSYLICFHFLTFCYVVCGASWSIEWIWVKLNKNEKK